MADNYEERKSAVLEGMYKGVERKIDEIKQSVSKELQYTSEQQASAQEALAESFQQAIEAVLNELRYLAQQNSAIYDYGKRERAKEKEDILKALDEGLSASDKRLAEAEEKLAATASGLSDDPYSDRIDAVVRSLDERTGAIMRAFEDQMDRVGRMMDEKLEAFAHSVNDRIDAHVRTITDELHRSGANSEQLDYLCRILPEQIEGLHRNAGTDGEILETREVRYDDRFQRDLRESIRADLRAELRDYGYSSSEQKSETARSYDGAFDDSFDYGVLAEKIVSMLPETDYDLIADRVVAALPQTDENALADKIVASIPQTDENAIADRIADAVPLTDYDLIAEKVAAVMEHEFDVTVDEAGISRIAASVAEELDYDRIAAKVTEFVKAGENEVRAEVDADAVAGKIAEILGETEKTALTADEIANRVVEMLKENAEPQTQVESTLTAEEVAACVVERMGEQPAEQPMEPNYDEIAQRISEILREDAPIPVVDYDRIAQQVVYGLRMDEQVRADETVTEDGVANRVVELMQASDAMQPFTVDYDLIASKVAATIRADMPHASADGEENFTADDIAGRVVTLIHERELQEESGELTAEEIAEKVAEILAAKDAQGEQPEETLTADGIAARVLELLRESEAEEEPLELDYDEIASKVADAIRGDMSRDAETVSVTETAAPDMPSAEEIAEKVAEILGGQEKAPQEFDYDQMAVRVAQCVRMVHEEPDYDHIAARVSDYLKAEESAEAGTKASAFDYDLLAEKITERVATLGNSADEIAQKVADLFAEDEPVAEESSTDETLFDYDLLAEKVAEHLRTEGASENAESITADGVARRVLELMKESGLIEEGEFEEEAEQTDGGAREEFARQIAELRASTEEIKAAAVRFGEEGRGANVGFAAVNASAPQASWNAEEIADRVAELMKYDEIAAKLYEQLGAEDIAARVVSLLNTEHTLSQPAVTADEIAQKIADLFAETEPLEEEVGALPTVEEIARKVAESISIPEAVFSTDEIAQKVAEAISIPEAVFSTDEIAQKVAESISIPEAVIPTDEIAQKVAESISIPETEVSADEIAAKIYEQLSAEDIAARVAALLGSEDRSALSADSAEEIAQKVAELISVPEVQISVGEIAEKVADLIKEELPVQLLQEEELAAAAEPAPAPRPEPVPEPIPAPAPIAEPEPEFEEEIEPEFDEDEEEEPIAPPSKAQPKAKKPVKKMQPAPEPALTTRLKKSFTAKLIESEEDVKDYYSELKNQLLSYVKVKSQINWSNDRFTYDRETIAKICLRGKTLCLYLALDPEEFPTTVYHQKFAGDTKMYEKTPMMMKVKSPVALKRSIKLIELLMERVQAVKGDRKAVDYAAKFAYRSEEQLLGEGLIKSVLVEKSKLDF